jgi:hypothetical protein
MLQGSPEFPLASHFLYKIGYCFLRLVITHSLHRFQRLTADMLDDLRGHLKTNISVSLILMSILQSHYLISKSPNMNIRIGTSKPRPGFNNRDFACYVGSLGVFYVSFNYVERHLWHWLYRTRAFAVFLEADKIGRISRRQVAEGFFFVVD